MAESPTQRNGGVASENTPPHRGRPPGKRQALKYPSDFRKVILRVGQQRITINIAAGVPREMTLFRANFFWLATGSRQSRLCALNFVELVFYTASLEHQLSKMSKKPPPLLYAAPGESATEIRRRPNGQFEPGGPSPNGAGRPKRESIPLPSMFCKEMLAVANEMTSVKVDGGQTRQVTLFEAKVLELGSGRTRDRLACKSFIEKVIAAASREQQLGKSEPASLETFPPMDLSDEEWEEREKMQADLARLVQANPSVTELSDKELMRRMRNIRQRGDALDDG